jgi:tetraacyldisaccharide 4'-kinase
VLYTSGQVSTHLPGFLALRTIAAAWPLAAWLDGDPAAAKPLAALRGQPLLAVAGLAAPEKFFAMLEAEGLQIERLPLADHHVYRSLPWPEDAPRVITTEKDAVKINPGRIGATQVWVVPLDLQLPPALVGELMALLFGPGSAPPPP